MSSRIYDNRGFHQPSPPHSYSQQHTYKSPLPSLTLQRPSITNSNTLPPIAHIRPGSDPRPSRPNPPRPNLGRHSSSPHLASIHLPTPRITSPTSRASDLAIYAMTKDEKPIIDADGTARSRSPSNGEERSPRLSLPPFNASRSDTTPLSIDVEASRKRKMNEREDGDAYSPGTPHSYASSAPSAYLTTPQMAATEPAHKRRGSIIEHLMLTEKDQKLGLYGSKGGDSPWYKPHSPYDMANFPIPPQQPVTVFPVQYGWPNNGTAPPNPGANGSPNPAAAGNGINVDPALSSLRSSADQPINNGHSTLPPQLRFPDETLASATASAAASPARDGTDQAESSTAALAAIAAGAAQQNGSDLLAPPGSADEQIKKDQPFSRSPELRVSHKMAERKRRKEMKDLFDELREELPADRGMKASKWEILSKAIDFVRHLKNQQVEMHREIEHCRRELDIARGGTGAYPPTYPTYNMTSTYPPPSSYATTSAAPLAAGMPPPQPQAQVPMAGQPQLQQVQTPQVQVQAPQVGQTASPAQNKPGSG